MLELKEIMIFVAIMAVIIGGVYMMYTKASSSNTSDVLSITKFCLEHLDSIIRSIEEISDNIGGIDINKYENEADYRRALIDATIHVIEEQLSKANMTLSLSHDSLVNLSQVIIDRIIEEKRKKEAAKAIEEDCNDEYRLEDHANDSSVTDISESLSDFYNK